MVLRGRPDVWPLALAVALSVAAGATVTLFSPPATASVYAVLLCGGLALFIGIRLWQSHDVLDPLTLVLASVLFYFGLHALWLQSNPPLRFRPPTEAGLIAGLLLVAAGVAAMAGAYQAWDPRPSVLRENARIVPTAAILAVFAAGFALRLYGLQVGAFQRSVELTNTAGLLIITTLSYASLIAFVVASYQHYRFATSRWLMIAVGVAHVAFALAVGRKELIAEVVIAWLATRHYAHRRMSVRFVAVTVLVFMFVFTPLIQSGRDTKAISGLTAREQSDMAASTLPARARALVSHPGELLTGWDTIHRRTIGIESVGLATDFTPATLPYQYGESYVAIPLALVPGFVWPDKPTFDTTVAFARQYANQPSYSGLSVGPTLPGDLYLNFGLFGVIAGFAIVGLILKWLTAWIRLGDLGIALGLYAVTMPKLLLVELSLSALGQYLVLNILLAAVVLAAFRFVSRPPQGSLTDNWEALSRR